MKLKIKISHKAINLFLISLIFCLSIYGAYQVGFSLGTGTSYTISTDTFNEIFSRLDTLEVNTAYPQILASYVIFNETISNEIYAKNGVTGKIDYSGTDASTVITSALGSGNIFILLKSGTYTIDTKITIPSNTTFCGVGFSTILKKGDSLNDKVLFALQSTGIIISNLKIDGNSASGVGDNGINFRGVTFSIIENVWVINTFNTHGIDIEEDVSTTPDTPSNNVIVRNCIVTESGGNGIDLDNSINLVVSNCVINSSSSSGIGATNLDGSIISNNIIILSGANGILLETGSKSSILTGNQINQSGQHGIYILNSQDNSITGNSVYESCYDNPSLTYVGIMLTNSSYNSVVGNGAVDRQAAPTQNYGLKTTGTSNYNRVSGNTFSGNEVGDFIHVGSNDIFDQRLIWIDDEIIDSKADLDSTEDWTWIDIDKTSTSPHMILAYLVIGINVDTIGTENLVYVQLRMNGVAQTAYPEVRLNKNSTVQGEYNVYQLLCVGVDSGQIFEWQSLIGTGWQVDIVLILQGYVEEIP